MHEMVVYMHTCGSTMHTLVHVHYVHMYPYPLLVVPILGTTLTLPHMGWYQVVPHIPPIWGILQYHMVWYLVYIGYMVPYGSMQCTPCIQCTMYIGYIVYVHMYTVPRVPSTIGQYYPMYPWYHPYGVVLGTMVREGIWVPQQYALYWVLQQYLVWQYQQVVYALVHVVVYACMHTYSSSTSALVGYTMQQYPMYSGYTGYLWIPCIWGRSDRGGQNTQVSRRIIEGNVHSTPHSKGAQNPLSGGNPRYTPICMHAYVHVVVLPCTPSIHCIRQYCTIPYMVYALVPWYMGTMGSTYGSRVRVHLVPYGGYSGYPSSTPYMGYYGSMLWYHTVVVLGTACTSTIWYGASPPTPYGLYPQYPGYHREGEAT